MRVGDLNDLVWQKRFPSLGGIHSCPHVLLLRPPDTDTMRRARSAPALDNGNKISIISIILEIQKERLCPL